MVSFGEELAEKVLKILDTSRSRPLLFVGPAGDQRRQLRRRSRRLERRRRRLHSLRFRRRKRIADNKLPTSMQGDFLLGRVDGEIIVLSFFNKLSE